MRDRNENEGTGMILLYKNITFTFNFSKGVVAGVCVRDRKTEGDENRLPYWPIISSSFDHITLCYLHGLTSLLLLLPSQWPLWADTSPGAWRPVSVIKRISTQDSRFKTDPCKTPCICCRPCIYNFKMPTYSGCHPRDVFPPIYTNVPVNHIVYTAGTSGSVKGQLSTTVQSFFVYWELLPTPACTHRNTHKDIIFIYIYTCKVGNFCIYIYIYVCVCVCVYITTTSCPSYPIMTSSWFFSPGFLIFGQVLHIV